MRNAPILILAFNRPRYLEAVLTSLLAQTALGAREVFLFQDNAVNPHSGMRYAGEETIAKSIETFRRLFPRGTVLQAPHNLGICENYRRAEEFAFREMKSEVAYFFEDDMVLSPHYLATLDQMCAFALACDTIGHFSCYGSSHLASLETQRQRSAAVTRLEYHWGFGLTRRHWSELEEWLAPYYEMMRGCDYRRRPREKIRAWMLEHGYPAKWSTEDHIKKVGSYALGRVSLNTQACFGRNVGVFGFHTTPLYHRSQGRDRTTLYPDPVGLDFPGPEGLARLYAEEISVQWRRIIDVGKARPALAESRFKF
jgi:hypothetical protein